MATRLNNDKIYIAVDQFFKEVEKRRSTGEKPLRKDNFLTYKKASIISFNDVKYCECSTIIHYCYDQRARHAGCKMVCSQIEKKVCGAGLDGTALSLYRIIKDYQFGKTEEMMLWTLDNFSILPENVPSLAHEHSEQGFTDFEWKKIAYFEWHFGNAYPGIDRKCYDEVIQKKYEYFDSLVNAEKMAASLHHEGKSTITRRQVRHTLGDPNQIWLYFGKEHKHVPAVIEKDIEIQLKRILPQFEESVVCMDCTKKCNGQVHGVHLYIEHAECHEPTEMQHIAILAEAVIKRKHNLNCSSVMFFAAGAFKLYLQDDDIKTHHFKLRDAIEQGKLDDCLLCTIEPLAQEHDWSDAHECETCRGDIDSHLTPLHWNSFCAAEEWAIDVPMNIQIMLETFINKETVKKTKDLNEFLKVKIVRLYALYDILLNTSNRKHCGVIQELSTSELMMNYQNLGFTFSLTHLMGITVGQTTAEEQWNERATDDVNYYNYALRKYPLVYETKAGKSEYLVSLRDCYNIAMRDNLVTITEKSNPKPSESRHGQICTLQGTDIGIPKDSTVIDDIHAENGCDAGEEKCPCNQHTILHKDDLHKVLLDLTSEEAKQMTKCTQLCVWGMGQVWSQVQEGNSTFSIMNTQACNYNPKGLKSACSILDKYQHISPD